MSKTSNDPMKTDAATTMMGAVNDDAMRLREWLHDHLEAERAERSEVARYIEAIAAMPVKDALRLLTFTAMRPHNSLPRLD
jgi:hypothetical protein